MKRRAFVSRLSRLALWAGLARFLPAGAQNFMPPQDLRPLIEGLTGGRPVTPGKVSMDMPAIAENGNTIPFTLKVDSPMTPALHVRRVHVFAPRNPRPRVAVFHFGPDCARAEVSTRVRLSGTQKVLAIAELSDGSFWSGEQPIVVTAAACLDEALG